MSFELLEQHPCDIGFRAEAVTLPQLFDECARALQFIIFEPSDVKERDLVIQVNAEGTDYESLLVNWLNELLYYLDAQRLAFDFFDIEFTADTNIRCQAFGGKRDPLKQTTKLLVKAVTYRQLRVTKTEKLWSADVYVEV